MKTTCLIFGHKQIIMEEFMDEQGVIQDRAIVYKSCIRCGKYRPEQAKELAKFHWKTLGHCIRYCEDVE